MNPATWKTIKETFSTALDLPLPERATFLEESSEEIRREVEKLLSTYLEAQTFIGTPLIVEKGLRPNPLEESLSGKKIDDYFVLEKLGEGGMGTVFLAEHCGQGFSKRVALKLIKRGMDTNAMLGRFLLERQILADLEHPNIARLYGGGSTTDGLPYFVMEHVEGESIREFCDNQRFDINNRLRLFTKVCEAVSYAHQQLIVHRDIKPSNIIVTASGEPKLLDFGIAKLLLPSDRNAERTATQFHVMTPEYASPEQLSGKATTTATDVYSLGVVLYELLTGTRPFDFKGKSLIEISDQLRTQRPMRPSDCQSVTERAADVISTKPVPKGSDTSSGTHSRPTLTSIRSLKGDLDNIILQAIRREPERRYQSVVEFSDDIERYLTGLPVKATGDTVGYRTRKFINRHRTVVAATVCFMLLLLLSTTITGWQYFVARAQRGKAEQRLTELRGVAKSLLTETNGALKKLPQGLEIRKSIVEKSVAVLDNLASEESNDPNFLNELADAYDELARIRHWQLHQSRLALSDVQKAVELRRRAIALAPTPANHKKLSDTLPNMAEVYTSLSDQEGLLRVWQDLRENDLRIIELEPGNPQSYFSASTHGEDLANALGELGRTDESAAQLKVSFDLIEKAISLQQAAPVSIDGQLALVWSLMQKANLLHRSQRSDEALAVYQSAADLAEKTYHADNTKVFAFNHASRSHRYMADIYAEKGDWQKYLECSEFSVNWIKQNYDNRNLWFGSVPPNTAYYMMRAGIGLNKVGQRAAGIATFEEGMKQYRDGLPTRVDDGEGLYYAFEILEPATEFYLDTNQDNKAIGMWEQYIRLAEPFVAKNPDDTTSLGLVAHALDRKGDVLAKYQKEPKTFAATDPARLGAALKSYEESRQRRQKMLQLDPTNQAHLDGQKALEEKISRLNARLKK
jgi:serine/threonine protein kinase/tetratricopeptide (TPR) repeat protein